MTDNRIQSWYKKSLMFETWQNQSGDNGQSLHPAGGVVIIMEDLSIR